MSENAQSLPAGLPTAAQAASQQPAAPAPAPTNPMLHSVAVPPAIDTSVPAPKPEPKITVPNTSGDSDIADMITELQNDPQVKLAVTYLENAAADGKLDTERALAKALTEMDTRFIDEAYIREVLKDKAQGFIDTARSMVEYAVHKQTALIDEVHQAAGGAANWAQAVAAWKKNATPEEVEALSANLDSGNKSKVKYATDQILKAAERSGQFIKHNSPVLGQNGRTDGLSAKGYQDALAKLGRNPTEQQYAELRAARELGKKQGL
jgi:hypothetical protein